MPINAADIAQIRAFNRFYTKVIGLLEDGMHNSPYTLTEARIIYELGRRGRATASSIAETLDMDRGQMSRLVLRLIDQGVLATLPRIGDRRAAPMALTPHGDKVFAHLNAMSDAAAADALLEPLDEFGRRDLVSAMRRIETLLSEPDDEPLVLRPHRIGELGWLIHRQGLLYHLEQGWNGEFETLIARIYADFETAPANPPKSLWIAELGGEVAGSIFIIPAADEAPGTAQLRMLYVDPAFRGRGIGKRLVDEAVRFSRASGYSKVILWTQDCLVSARRIYQAAGFTLEREERHQSFGADLNGQYWALTL
ncbi:transcriptional regulator, MarR family with acetyltransferase activity [Devosia sp. YR412]|uniref:bifunctional helix-turn-helix transcriptional regulator/GNAT family N-acetyltransferase n=1 Tax=Devosia sp. YR412 TaxID=1881030 RepID=UPI0008C1BC19|nr:helix-turn-helix domain-containing GNAT family N-acetyltransferase [Devosia sp. YR412]SEP70164.1 transcriptional regulator, MarR family with acetyltransferase activity [Devosia sp. YR412]